jgi:hypothetical protein
VWVLADASAGSATGLSGKADVGRAPNLNVSYALQMVPQGHAPLQRPEDCCAVALLRCRDERSRLAHSEDRRSCDNTQPTLPSVFHDNFRIVLNGSRGSYPGYVTIPRNAG